jgi:hypothetical protein
VEAVMGEEGVMAEAEAVVATMAATTRHPMAVGQAAVAQRREAQILPASRLAMQATPELAHTVGSYLTRGSVQFAGVGLLPHMVFASPAVNAQ